MRKQLQVLVILMFCPSVAIVAAFVVESIVFGGGMVGSGVWSNLTNQIAAEWWTAACISVHSFIRLPNRRA